ncbi:CRISPR-associated helicase Cas3' [Streptomyces xiangluensis]|uniref:CRISPR-associated helicase Cas3 n=1 Tax=Streptomyces xiangluensis TaxID=2665720 RepID=A0ABV8YTB4_9ACTN
MLRSGRPSRGGQLHRGCCVHQPSHTSTLFCLWLATECERDASTEAGDDMTDRQKPVGYRLVWAKTDRHGASRSRGGPAWNPLPAHLCDAAATALELWDRYLTPALRAQLADTFGAGDDHLARAVTAFYAALHDLGKASPAFLNQFGKGRYATTQLRAARQKWESTAREAGLPLPDEWAGIPWARHEHVTAAVLPQLTGCDCGPAGCRNRAHKGLHTAAYSIAAHHGHIPDADTVGRAHGATDAQWTPIHQAVVHTIAAMTGIDTAQLTELVDLRRPSSLVAFTGLVVLCDWIASDEVRFTYRSTEQTDEAWWKDSQTQAQAAITDLRLERWHTADTTWEDLWPGTRPRPFQADAMRIMPHTGPALVIVESDTGSGKTRLALWCAHHLAVRNGYQGLYMAMPTRAATNQAAAEIEAFMNRAIQSDTANLAIVHGTAAATPMVHRLIDATRPPQAADSAADDLLGFVLGTLDTCDRPENNPAHEPTGQRAVLDPWYLRRCLGLIATFGIGTIDQLVLATQKSRHWFLRMLGLMGKTVIIDEAHAYELYQQDLLAAAVEWLADAGASVIVLSATLPASVRDSLTTAWSTGLGVQIQDTNDTGPITVVDGTGRLRRAGPPPTQVPALHTTIRLDPDPGPQALAAQLLRQATSGGCIGVIRTRVTSATSLYEQARAQAAQHGWHHGEIILLHGQLMPRDRQPIEERLTHLLGPGTDHNRHQQLPNPHRPTRLLVIATQIIEQSLDIDLDHMVTDLAPIDLIIQRRGRVHRHTANNPHRPAWCAHPRMRTLYIPDPTEQTTPLVEPPAPNKPGNPDGFVYAPYILAATFRELHTRRSRDRLVHISTPRDSSPLIEAVYGPRQTTSDSAWKPLLDRTRTQWQHDLDQERKEAKSRVVRPYIGPRRTPTGIRELASGALHGDGDEGGIAGIRAVSRLGDPSITAICLYQQPDGTISYDPAGSMRADLSDHKRATSAAGIRAHRQQQRDLLLNTIALPATWFRGAKALPAPETWPVINEPAIRNSLVMLLNPAGTCKSGPTGHVTYNTATGLARH